MKFLEFMLTRFETGGFTTEDILSSSLPFLRQVVNSHAKGMVVDFRGVNALSVESGVIWFNEKSEMPVAKQTFRIREIDKPRRGAVEVVNTYRDKDDENEAGRILDLSIGDSEQEITKPIYLPDYANWEQELGHHDPVTDIFNLGMILASLACGLDFHRKTDLEMFVENRDNLFNLAPDLHPVIAQAIARMTELSRHKRPQDLAALLRNLENYKEQDVEFDIDLASIAGFAAKKQTTKQELILDRLRNRLFDLTKRNRLLHFKPTMTSVNLTQTSVPLSFDIENIRTDQIITWNHRFSKKIIAGKKVSLNQHLNLREVPYVPAILDRIRVENKRDLAEYGFAQLRLALCFLKWSDLKQSPPEQYNSPLILLPVKLERKKGITDNYHLEAQSSEAEINPVIRHLFRQLYDIRLPESIDLAEVDMEEFHKFLLERIKNSEPSVDLTIVDHPKIDLIYSQAKKQLDKYRRRRRITGRGIKSFMNIDYSYDLTNFYPLGVRIFSECVRPKATDLHSIVEESPDARHFIIKPEGEPDDTVKERTFYSLRDEGNENPYAWSLDLCNITLGTFKYRKMTLVKDYDTLLDSETLENPGFDSIFSPIPKDIDNGNTDDTPFHERYHVVPCDPTQDRAINLASKGVSYIIQGPPGTGKSQTITNLIADYIVKGKRVLFVCEKRSAIDVVYHRLGQRNLDELCCLVHDSQTDKKEFIMDLKKSYERFIGEANEAIESKVPLRGKIVEAINNELEPIFSYDGAMLNSKEGIGLQGRDLISRVILASEKISELDATSKERLPKCALWMKNREKIANLHEIISGIRSDAVFLEHPLRRLNPSVADKERPLELISASLKKADGILLEMTELLDVLAIPREFRDSLDTIRLIAGFTAEFAVLASDDTLELLDVSSKSAKSFAKKLKKHHRLRENHASAVEKNRGWINKLSNDEVKLALARATAFEHSFLAFLKPDWWRLRRVLNQSFDFSSQRIRPTWSLILNELREEYECLEKIAEFELAIEEEYELEVPAAEFIDCFKKLWNEKDNTDVLIQKFVMMIVSSEKGKEIFETILTLNSLSFEFLEVSRPCLTDIEQRPLSEIRDELRTISDSLDLLPDFIYCLQQLNEMDPEVASAFRVYPFDAKRIEAAVLNAAADDLMRSERILGRFTSELRKYHSERAKRLIERFHKINAEVIRESVRKQFIGNVRVAALSATVLDQPRKEFKKLYNRGRRILEHEFGKSMRYKSIRDLSAGDSGLVIRDLKPVWLMSPLSVSDTLPLHENSFDVVIFDEASQVTLEEAVPALFRARQVIVVGDEMQLPPTKFFAAKQSEEEESFTVDTDDGTTEYDLNSNSFLKHATLGLPSEMLGWHYRSRSESLISFSNAAFYENKLLTVPENRIMDSETTNFNVATFDDLDKNVSMLNTRPLSFHFMEQGVYENRRNRVEAEYIALLVRRLLLDENDESIGIIAFSEAQQGEIDSAMNRLAADDKLFREKLDLELDRQRDGQFCGLLVKNLENIQGDERDVIIMSICYGYDKEKKMRMNFGPINQHGGEKRLNVAFSRAKHNMLVVSSIHYSDITNDYNTGANCLKNYLRYAEAHSSGTTSTANAVLREMSLWRDSENDDNLKLGPLQLRLGDALKSRGYICDYNVGQSTFRCDIAVRKPDDETYRLGLVLCENCFFDQRNIIEREIMRPALLEMFDWRVHLVLAIDWYVDRNCVLEKIIDMMENVQEPDSEDFNVEIQMEPTTETALSLDSSEDGFSSTNHQHNGTPSRTFSESSFPPPLPPPLAPPDTHTVKADDPPTLAKPLSPTSNEKARADAVVSYLECVNEKSNKFWEATLSGSHLNIRYGRIGAAGTRNIKSFDSPEKALLEKEKLIRQKLSKGYQLKS